MYFFVLYLHSKSSKQRSLPFLNYKQFKVMKRMSQYLRCTITYEELSHIRVLHYAVRDDYVDDFIRMIKATFVLPVINFTDIIYSCDSRKFFQLF